MERKQVKNIAILLSPLLLFVVLLIPYSWLQQTVIVDIFGCGCPKFTEAGELITPDFNGNDFTAIFWSAISLCAAVLAAFLSKRITPKWLRVVYVIVILLVSLLISGGFCQMMMMN